MTNDITLGGKIAVITGAASGIGRATAMLLPRGPARDLQRVLQNQLSGAGGEGAARYGRRPRRLDDDD